MINLIPQVAKDKIVSEYWIRVVSVWLLIISIVSIVVSLLLLPTYVLITSKVNAYTSSATEGAEKIAEYDVSYLALTEVNKQAQMLLDLRKVKQTSELIETLESIKGSEITITKFSIHRSGMGLESVNINGKATTRKSLSDFRDLLLTLPEVKDVKLPISNLAKDRDIKFDIAIVLKGEENKI